MRSFIPLLVTAIGLLSASRPSARSVVLAQATEQAASSVSPAAKPAEAPTTLSLPIEGYGDAVVSVPPDAPDRRPLLIAVHGKFDRPEGVCGVWQKLVGDRGFVLCPRGIERIDSPAKTYTYESPDALGKEVDAGIEALRARFPERLDDERLVYTGFSLGSHYGVPYVTRDPARTPRVVMIEGGHAQWTPKAVSAFAKKGGLRVLFACGQPGCVTMSKGPIAALSKAGVGAKVVYGAGVGHGYDRAVAARIADELDWLFDGDDRWAAPRR